MQSSLLLQVQQISSCFLKVPATSLPEISDPKLLLPFSPSDLNKPLHKELLFWQMLIAASPALPHSSVSGVLAYPGLERQSLP